MKRLIIFLPVLMLALSCAQQGTVGKNDAAKRRFDAWVNVQKTKHPEYKWQQTELGSWILEETVGTGAAPGDPDDFPYIRCEITTEDLDGNIITTSSAALAKKLRKYEPSYYYGPVISYRGNNSLYAGVEEVLAGMKAGGSVRAAIPGWLLTGKRYKTAKGYLDNVTGTDAIYTIKLVESIADIEKWELDSLARFIPTQGISPADSAGKEGFYYIRKKAPVSDHVFPTDTTVYINYIGRLLNGLVFDTNIADSAEFYGIRSASRTYGPVKITWASEYSSITMGSSSTSLAEGFAFALSKMKAYEKGRAIFRSYLGYKESGVPNTAQKVFGVSIPGYSPLIFDIELVDKN